MTPEEEYIAALPADGSEVRHDDVYWQLMRDGKGQAADAFHDLRRAGKVNFRIDKTDLANQFVWVSRK